MFSVPYFSEISQVPMQGQESEVRCSAVWMSLVTVI